MKDLNLSSYDVEEIKSQELSEINGGGEWKLWEAGIAFALCGVLGVVAYTIGTKQG